MKTDNPAHPQCPQCGNEQGIYAGGEYRWQPATQTWEMSELGGQLDCTACDHNWSLEGSDFPRIASDRT